MITNNVIHRTFHILCGEATGTAFAVPTTTDGGNMAGDDFLLTAGWGHFGQGEAVMPGQGRVVERPYTAEEQAALGNVADTLEIWPETGFSRVVSYTWGIKK